MSNKKYTIRESELKEIIKEMILLEVADPSDYRNMYLDKSVAGKATDHVNVSNGLAQAANVIKSIPNAFLSDEYKEKAFKDGGFMQWLLGALGAGPAGATGPDYVWNWGQWDKNVAQNPDAHEVLDTNVACNFLRSIANRAPIGKCAKYVRIALNRGGLGLPYGRPAGSAKNYINILPSNGWERIPLNQAGSPCDVIVINSCVDSAGVPHRDGHIAMCVGNGVWISDYLQSTWHGLKAAPPESAVYAFRYRNLK